MKACVTAEFTDGGVARLEALGYQVVRSGWGTTRQALDAAAYREAAAGSRLLVTEIETVDAELLDALPELRLVATARGGPVNVDLAACAARGIPVVFTPARNADSVADFVLGALLSLARRIGAGERHLREHGWLVGDELPYLHFRGPELAGRTLGVVGYGAIGRRVAQRARDGFGMRVLFTDPVEPGGIALEELLERSDVVSLHCPRTPATRGLLDAAALARLRPDAYLVNTAGGGIVDQDALVAALSAGRLAGAALDVFATEPLPRDSPLLTAPNLLLTPHLAGAAQDVVRHHTEAICADVERWHRGDPMVNVAGQAPTPEPAGQARVLGQPELLAVQQTSGYREFVQQPALSVGLFRALDGHVDSQTPHDQDEVYVVLAGSAVLDVDGTRTPVGAGSVAYVPPRVPHRFTDIRGDLQVVVVFAPRYTGPL